MKGRTLVQNKHHSLTLFAFAENAAAHKANARNYHIKPKHAYVYQHEFSDFKLSLKHYLCAEYAANRGVSRQYENHKYKNKCVEEVDYINELEKLEKESIKYDKLREKVNLISEIESIVENANSSYNAVRPVNDSKRKRLNEIRDNRKDEKNRNREENAFELEVEEKKSEGQVVYLNREEVSDGIYKDHNMINGACNIIHSSESDGFYKLFYSKKYAVESFCY